MKNYATILFAIFLCSHVLIAQEPSDGVRTKSQFSIALLNGIGHTRYQQTFGNLSNLDRLNSTHVLMFKYRYRFSEKLYAEAGFGFGTHIENLKTPLFEDEGFDFWNYEAFFHSRIEFNGAYEILKHKNKQLYGKLGVGWNRFAAYSLGSGSGFLENSYQVSYEVPGERLPFISLGLDYSVPTKRKDELSFYLGYQLGFSSFYRGNYQLIQNSNITAQGALSSNLKSIQFGIGYSFTRIKRKENIEQKLAENNGDLKSAKKKERFEKRAIDPKSQYVSAAIGIGVNQTRFKPNRDPFYGPGTGSVQYRLSYERGWKNNIFLEADVYGFLFWQSEFIKLDFGSTGSLGNAFFGSFLSAGAQYKIQNKKTNFQFFNVHGGLGLGFHFYEKGPSS
jgi:hypothetical protein